MKIYFLLCISLLTLQLHAMEEKDFKDGYQASSEEEDNCADSIPDEFMQEEKPNKEEQSKSSCVKKIPTIIITPTTNQAPIIILQAPSKTNEINNNNDIDLEEKIGQLTLNDPNNNESNPKIELKTTLQWNDLHEIAAKFNPAVATAVMGFLDNKFTFQFNDTIQQLKQKDAYGRQPIHYATEMALQIEMQYASGNISVDDSLELGNKYISLVKQLLAHPVLYETLDVQAPIGLPDDIIERLGIKTPLSPRQLAERVFKVCTNPEKFFMEETRKELKLKDTDPDPIILTFVPPQGYLHVHFIQILSGNRKYTESKEENVGPSQTIHPITAKNRLPEEIGPSEKTSGKMETDD